MMGSPIFRPSSGWGGGVGSLCCSLPLDLFFLWVIGTGLLAPPFKKMIY